MHTIGHFTISRHNWGWAVYTEGATKLCEVFNSISEARAYVMQRHQA